VTLTEDRFTPPRPDCPNPELWHSADDESTEIEVTALVAAFVGALKPDLVVETGTAFGQTAAAIAQALITNGRGRLFTCETDPARHVVAMKKVWGPVRFFFGPSLDLIATLEDQSVGFAWLDSLIPLRVLEARALAPKMLPGAIVGFHDTGPQHGYRPQVEALFKEGWMRGIYLPTPRGVMFAEYVG
jgi:tRNA A58 N-methylase Trm61